MKEISLHDAVRTSALGAGLSPQQVEVLAGLVRRETFGAGAGAVACSCCSSSPWAAWTLPVPSVLLSPWSSPLDDAEDACAPMPTAAPTAPSAPTTSWPSP